jgi:hypothetical protein
MAQLSGATMSVYKKLQDARIRLQRTTLSKSGHNKFAGYQYFELGDFLPAIQEICNEVGLCGVITFTQDMASLTIFDTESEGSIVFYSPMSSAALKGCHEVQNLGAVQTYLRRYLWTNAFEIVEHDALDASTRSFEPVKQEIKPTPKPVERTNIEGSGDWAMVTKTPPEGDATEWLTVIDQTASIGLKLAKTKDDVMAIYKSNKQLFDAVKAKSPDFFAEMMKKFSDRKSELEGA